jgi:hypothetical protein
MGGHKYSTLISRMFLIVEPYGVTNLDVMMLIVGGHTHSSLISRKILIAEPSSITNLDVMMLNVGDHVYSTLNSCMFFIRRAFWRRSSLSK